MMAVSPSLDGHEILLTGGTGFIGRWLLKDLRDRWLKGERFHITVPSRDPLAFFHRYPICQTWPWLTLIKADVCRDPFHNSCSLFIHGAMDTSATAHQQPGKIFWTILDGARRVLEHAARHHARGVLLSSGAVYGAFPPGIQHAPEGARFAADCTQVGGGQSHGEAKRAMETLGAIAAHDGLAVCSARLFSFVGPGLPLDGHFAIGNFIADALHQRPITIKGDGQAIRSYLYAGELPHWLWTLALQGQAGQSYNVGSDHALPLSAWAELVRTVVNPDSSVQILGTPDGSPRHCYAPDLHKVSALGLLPLVSAEQAIQLTADFHHSKRDFFGEP